VDADADAALLVERLRGGDGRALADLYARYHERIWSFLLRLSGRRHLAEDLFQETWLAVARGAGRLRDDTDLRAWLFTVARNRYRSYRRWAVLDVARLFELGSEPAPHALAPDQEAEARAAAARAEAAFVQLSDPHREVLLLVVGEELDATQARRDAGRRGAGGFTGGGAPAAASRADGACGGHRAGRS
jgi:RNA polymerase sigma-70 factor, ECF subfamily